MTSPRPAVRNLKTISLVLPLLANSAIAEITKQPYLLIEEIEVTQSDSLIDASYEYYPTATAEESDGTVHIAGHAQAIVSPFRFFDFSAPYTFDYGCQYSDEVCDLLWYGFEDDNGDADEDGFLYYRERLEDQDDGAYTSQFLAFIADDNDIDTSSIDADTQISWTPVSEKFYAYDTSEEDSTDTRIHDLYIDSSDNLWAVGYDSSPYSSEVSVTNNDSDRDTLSRSFIQRAFLKNTTDGSVIELLPDIFYDDDEDFDLTDDYGGLSAAYKIIEVDGNIYAIGQASNGFIDEDDSDADYWEECQYDADDYYYCSGYTTQAWAWDITDIIDGSDTTTSELSGFALADDWVDTDSDDDYDLVNRSAIAYAMNSSGVGVGYSTIDISESVTGGHAMAATFICEDDDDDGAYGDDECDVTQLPNTADEDDYDDDEIDHQWAVDINNAGLIIGNSRSAESDNSNKAVEFFVFEAVTDSDGGYDFTDDDGSISWPLHDDPIDGANSEIKAINDNNLAVGFRDAEDEEQPSYNGTTRQQAAFLFDADSYLDGDDDYVWYLNDLICYEEDDEATTPYYLIEYATDISDDDDYSIIASGYRYDSFDDMDDGVDPTPVMLRLTINSAGDISDLASCPESEDADSSYERQGAASWGLLMLLIPFGFIRRSILRSS